MKELSRLERHRSRNKGRNKKTSDASPHGLSANHAPNAQVAYDKEEVAASSEGSTASGGLSRRSRYRGNSSEAVPKSASSRAAVEGEALDELPMRTRTYSSYRVRMSKWFVNSLIILFVLLMAALVWWGVKGAPPLKELL
ncbi:hypothetical protein CHH75_09890 [Paenibacillus sp. 7541]|uniref:Uncharacterized protein n=1 Tax=Paenibacillus campinasensis TaxID=66347 RepID=A0A268F2U2_9BACL|nr:hypothetical protein [Paenibacillus campinasensis]MUG64972.1 hypothetical protein [Paenibacillus campinasensis]PAD79690.1 hypothetical protein CHH67_02930 [Paenibacillus campinasensis]PAK53553.1 hypothetical protein CHH75_09890 [Paenibacillus sp. 7541]